MRAGAIVKTIQPHMGQLHTGKYHLVRHELGKYCVLSDSPIRDALQRTDANRSHMVFVVSSTQRLEGVFSDGDLRRHLMGQGGIDLNAPVSTVMNPKAVWASAGDSPGLIESLLHGGVTMVPLLDPYGHMVALAMQEAPEIALGPFTLGPDSPALVIAEVGNNHNGSIDLAKRMVDLAQEAGADCVKFQMRDIGSLYRNAGNPDDIREDLGSQYTLNLLSRFNLPPESLFEVFDHARARGILPLCTPWDLASVRSLESYGVLGYKIASADLTNHELLTTVAHTGRPILLSTGMSSEAEITESFDLLRRQGALFVPLHCNSTYPAPFKDVNLAYLRRLRTLAGGCVGYSGHERGWHVAVAAAACGAKVIEKHFTVDRGMEGNDHKVSLLPDEFSQMVRAIRDIEEAMGQERGRTLSQGEMINREALAKSLVAVRPVVKGEPITADMLEVKSPGKGLQPNRRTDLIGRRALRNVAAGDFFYPSDLAETAVEARPYRFRRSWGLPVRYHDVQAILARTNPQLVEYHLSYKDMDEKVARHFPQVLDLDLTVHSPEAFAGDHVMDLCSSDPVYRQRSIDEMKRVVALTQELRRFHARAQEPTLIVVNVGGFSLDAPLDKVQARRLYGRLAESLELVDTAEVEIIPQTMPPFPWHFGGQRFHNLFIDADEIAAFCRETGSRVCFDVSHSKLACSHFKWSFDEFVRTIGPWTAHLHLADAAGVDGEGLQVGKGEINFALLARLLDLHAPQASFIPEIWQGHKNDGEGFWVALDLLEEWF
jgi:N-acetylneuraminate synthase